MRPGARRQVADDLRHQWPHGGAGDDADALAAPAIGLDARRLNPRLEIADGPHAVLALLELAVPFRRRQRHVGLQIQIVRPEAPWRSAVGDRAGGKNAYGGEGGSAVLSGGLALERVFAGFGHCDWEHPHFPDRPTNAVRVAPRTLEL